MTLQLQNTTVTPSRAGTHSTELVPFPNTQKQNHRPCAQQQQTPINSKDYHLPLTAPSHSGLQSHQHISLWALAPPSSPVTLAMTTSVRFQDSSLCPGLSLWPIVWPLLPTPSPSPSTPSLYQQPNHTPFPPSTLQAHLLLLPDITTLLWEAISIPRTHKYTSQCVWGGGGASCLLFVCQRPFLSMTEQNVTFFKFLKTVSSRWVIGVVPSRNSSRGGGGDRRIRSSRIASIT